MDVRSASLGNGRIMAGKERREELEKTLFLSQVTGQMAAPSPAAGKMLSTGLGTKSPRTGTSSREDQEGIREGHSHKRQGQA